MTAQTEAFPEQTPEDEETALAQTPPAAPTIGPPAAVAPTPAPTPSANLSLSGDSYKDTAASSRKRITFNVGWTGGAKEDYVIVQQLKGYMKKSSGTPFKVKMYGASVDFDFSSWQVDSVDPDPVYWSTSSTRWNYSTATKGNKFSATDDPQPPSFAKGVKAEVDFKAAVYKSADVPTTTTGSIAAIPLTSFRPWSYHVEVLGGGKYKHS